MRHRKFVVFAVLLGITVITLSAYLASLNQNRAGDESVGFVEFPPTPVVSSDAHLNFIQTVGGVSSDQINTGLTIERMRIVELKDAMPSVNHVALLVLNHTQEPIKFDDVGFGVKVFESHSLGWMEVVMPYTPEPKEKILPPKLERFDFDILNSWEFTPEEFINVETGNLRILIGGVGMTSNVIYYAYVDLSLER